MATARVVLAPERAGAVAESLPEPVEHARATRFEPGVERGEGARGEHRQPVADRADFPSRVAVAELASDALLTALDPGS